MRVVIQRVSEASVKIHGDIHGRIGKGLLLLFAVETGDTKDDADWLAKKILNMRIFNDENDVMNLSLLDVNGELMVISQFTLTASTKKGNRPSYIRAERPESAIPLYEYFVFLLEKELNKKVATGIFAADMKVQLINDGPVTIIVDTLLKE